MSVESTYYLGRVIKLGQLDNEKLIESIQNPEFVVIRNNGWTFIDVTKYENYIIGVLAKYEPEGEVSVIDKKEHSRKIEKQSNLIVAQSAFIYIPEYSGIAFQKVTNHIEPHIFANRFSIIIKETNKNFFMDCEVEMITDLRTFAIKLSKLSGIYKISAKVNPPNPMFGDLWEPLKDYLVSRNTEVMKIEEDSSQEKPLATSLLFYVNLILEQKSVEGMNKNIAIGDSAILMAADGYGEGLVRGRQNEKIVSIKTSETIRNFTFDKIPEHQKLYEIVNDIFKKINEERHMRH